MPQLVFQIAQGADDGEILRNSATTEYPPTAGAYSRLDADSVIYATRRFQSGFYTVSNAYMRWDTSSIPAGARIDSAYLRMRRNMGAYNNIDGCVQTGDWFLFTGVDATDWTNTPGTNAFASFDPAGGSEGVDYDIALSNLSNISRTGYTGIRLHVSQRAADAAPTGLNEWYWRCYDLDGPSIAPRLVVNYTLVPVLRSTSSAGTPLSAAQSTLVVNKPAGLVVGDLMTMRVACSGGTGATITPPTATGTWTLVSGGRTNSTTALALAIYQKTAVQADVDATNYTITFDSNRKAAASIAAHYNTAGIGQSSGQANASSTSVTAPSVTTVNDDELLLFVGALDALSTYGPPSGMTERLDILGHTPSGAAAARTYYVGNTTTDGYKNFLEAGSAAPTAGYMTTNPQGWITATSAAGNSSQYVPDVERLATTFSSNTTTPKPPAALDTTLKDAIRFPSKLTGRMAATAWDVAFSFRSQTTLDGSGRALFRVWASKNADGTNARQLTSAVQVGATVSFTDLTTVRTSNNTTWNPGVIDLEDEYIFFQLAWEITTAGAGGGGNASRDVNLTVGSTARVITPSFQPAVSLAHEVADEARATAGATGTRVATATVAGLNIGHSLSLLPPSTTPVVGIDSILRWDTRAAVSKDTSLLWDTRAVVAKDGTLLWNILQAVGFQRIALWNLLEVAALSRDLRWDTRAVVAKDGTLLWDTLALVSADRSLLWNVLTSVAVSRSLLWDTRALAAKGATLLWDTRALAAKDASLLWNTLVSAGKDATLLWDTRALAAKDASLLWDTRALAAKDASLLWDTLVVAARNGTLLWDTLIPASKDASVVWDTYERVGKQATLLWDLLSPAGVVGTNATIVWDVLTPTSLDRSLVWDVLVPVAAQRDLRWDTYARAAKDATLLWDVLAQAGVVSTDATILWDVLEPVSSDATILWDILVPVSKGASLLWHTYAVVGTSRDVVWDVFALVPVYTEATLRWHTYALVGDSVSLRWAILGVAETPLYPDAILKMVGYQGDVSILRNDPEDVTDDTWLTVS